MPSALDELEELEARLDHATGRERLLRLLLELATDLTATPDPERALAAIVKRTRTLLASDVAYLSLNDPATGETYIRTSSGVISERYRGLRLPLGAGLLGRVAVGQSTIHTDNLLAYLERPGVDRPSWLPNVIEEEGIVAILGVPLRAQGRVLGALVVADRRARRHSHEERSFAEAISSHAAVALESAFRFDELQRALDERDRAEEELNAQLRAAQHRMTVERELNDLVTSRRPLAGILELLRRETNGLGLVVDPLGRLLAGLSREGTYSVSPEECGVSETWLTRAVSRIGGGDRYLDLGDGRYLFPAMAGSRVQGAILMRMRLDQDTMLLVERAARALVVVGLLEESRFGVSHRRQRALFEALISGLRGPRREVLDECATFGLSAETEMTVLCVDVTRDVSLQLLRDLDFSGGTHPGIGADRDGQLVIVTPTRAASAVMAAIRASHPRAAIGSASSSLDPVAIRTAHRDAHASLTALKALGKESTTASLSDLGMIGLMLSGAPAGFAKTFVRRTIGPLLDYDERKGTALAETALTFCQNDGNQASVGRQMHLHPNTVRQRLQRIVDLIGPDWSRAERRTDIHLALQVWKMSDTIR